MKQLQEVIALVTNRFTLVVLLVAGAVLVTLKIDKENPIPLSLLVGGFLLLAGIALFAPGARGSGTSDSSFVELPSMKWFQEIKDQLERCHGALIYLQAFSHPDEFLGIHREDLLAINQVFVQKIAEQPQKFRIIGTTTGEAGKPRVLTWLKDEISRRFPNVDASANLAKCVLVNDHQVGKNSATTYLIDDHLLFFRRITDANVAVYCRLNLNRTALAELIRIGFLSEFEEGQ